jgi:hypothetical protein
MEEHYILTEIFIPTLKSVDADNMNLLHGVMDTNSPSYASVNISTFTLKLLLN